MHPYLMQICVLTTLLLRSFVTEDFVASFHPLSPFPHPLHTCRKVWPHKFFEGITPMNSVNFGSRSYICVIDMESGLSSIFCFSYLFCQPRSNISITNNLDTTCYCYLQGLRKFWVHFLCKWNVNCSVIETVVLNMICRTYKL